MHPLVLEYVARLGGLEQSAERVDPPFDEPSRFEARENIGIGIGMPEDRNGPGADEWIDATITKLVGGPHSPLGLG